MVKCKCLDCGLLALRNKATRELVETEDEWRCGFRHEQAPADTYTMILCLARVVRLGRTDEEDVRREVDTKRDCEKFLKWEQGFTPKEH